MIINKDTLAQRLLECQKQGYYLISLATTSKVHLVGFNFINREGLTAYEVAKWWEYEPYSIGLMTRGLLIIDIDTATGHNLDIDGRQSRELMQNTRLLSTLTNSLHIYFKYTGDFLRSGQLLEGADVKKWENSHIVARPSKTAIGEHSNFSKDITIREAPHELIKAISLDVNKPIKVAKEGKHKHYEVLTLSDFPVYAKTWINAGLGNNDNHNSSAIKLVGHLLHYFSLEIARNCLLEENKNTHNSLPEKELGSVFRSLHRKIRG